MSRAPLCRPHELARLKSLYCERRHVLIAGESGSGKSWLISRMIEDGFAFALCSETGALKETCELLEMQVGLGADTSLRLVPRKNRLLERLAAVGKPVVFDGLRWAGPSLTSFIRLLLKRVPVWVCVASTRKAHCGHLWAMLWQFEKVPLLPLTVPQVRDYLAESIENPALRANAVDWARFVHRKTKGNIRTLHCFVSELVRHSYDLKQKSDRHLIEIDVKIRSLGLRALDSARNLRADWQELEDRRQPLNLPSTPEKQP